MPNEKSFESKLAKGEYETPSVDEAVALADPVTFGLSGLEQAIANAAYGNISWEDVGKESVATGIQAAITALEMKLGDLAAKSLGPKQGGTEVVQRWMSSLDFSRSAARSAFGSRFRLVP